LDFNGYVIENLEINTNQKGHINLVNGTINENLKIDAPNTSVFSTVNVRGLTEINRIALSTFTAEGQHANGIVMNGSGKLNLSGRASNANITVNTNNLIIFEGDYSGRITIESTKGNIQVDGKVARLDITNDAEILIRNFATISELNAEQTIILNVESEAIISQLNAPNTIRNDIFRVNTRDLHLEPV